MEVGPPKKGEGLVKFREWLTKKIRRLLLLREGLVPRGEGLAKFERGEVNRRRTLMKRGERLKNRGGWRVESDACRALRAEGLAKIGLSLGHLRETLRKSRGRLRERVEGDRCRGPNPAKRPVFPFSSSRP